MKKYHILLALSLCIFSFLQSNAQEFSGNYTIGTGETYESINEIWAAMQSGTVTGPITLKLKTGTYQENVQLRYLDGLSATNTVTIESLTGNREDVILQSDGSTLLWVTTGHITIRNLTLNQPSAYYAINLSSSAEFITFDNLAVNGYDNTSTSNRNSNFYVNGASDITLKNSEVMDGSYFIPKNSLKV